jgi:hypothetical protein
VLCFQVLVRDVQMLRGVMLLQPHNFVILGGQVERLEAARQQAVACWNKPAGGRGCGGQSRAKAKG